MMTRAWARAIAAALVVLAGRGPLDAARQDPATPQQIAAAIDRLGDLDYDTRTAAARVVRRGAANLAVTALVQAALEHADGYVRYRALVLLTGYEDPRGDDVLRQVMTDPNDRLREVAFNHFAHHPDPSLVPALVAAADKEQSEFVRPALIRALAGHGADPRARALLLLDVKRGQDFFRSAVIEALGEFKASYAMNVIAEIARLDGPLQDDSALALGRIGDQRALEVLAQLQRSAPRQTQPALAAAICLLGLNCASHQRFIEDTLRFAATTQGFQDLLRSAASSLSAVADAGNGQALSTLFDVGIPSTDPVRAPIALAIGSAALRNPSLLVSTIERRTDRDASVELLRDAFDMLEEDFDEERFFVFIRRTYWKSAEGSATREVCRALIDALEF